MAWRDDADRPGSCLVPLLEFLVDQGQPLQPPQSQRLPRQIGDRSLNGYSPGFSSPSTSVRIKQKETKATLAEKTVLCPGDS
ncbi:hypothetical protein [Laspinema palackyanum]|uniref:hypothetical protein n=1 Tax=Laspinema palackyanum TaxID=3231601 RepID=UPI00349F92CE